MREGVILRQGSALLLRKGSIKKYVVPVSLAGIVGILWALPYLLPLMAGLAWFCPALLVLIAGSSNRLNPFQMGYLSGLYFNLAALYWFLNMPVFGAGILSWLCLSAYCALFPAAWALFCWRMLPSVRPSKLAPSPLNQLFCRLVAMNWLQRQLWALTGAAGWVAVEMLQSHLFTGFPWNLLAVSQIEMIPVIQLASITGVYGVSFLVCWVSISLLLAIGQIANIPGQPFAWSREILPAGLVLVIIASVGFHRIQSAPKPSRNLRLALVQPSVDQTVIWEGTFAEERTEELLRLSEQALTHKPHLLVWPESALPASRDSQNIVTRFTSENGIPLIFNDLEIEETKDPETPLYFNSVFLVNGRGQLVGSARKRHLVMFGEYTPFAKQFPVLDSLSPIGSSLSSGTEPGILELQQPSLSIGLLVCFEDAFPSLARDLAREKPDLLVNLTNDAWFGRSLAQWQHAKVAAFRAIETGLPLVRCSNNGITCWIDPYGRMNLGDLETPEDVYKSSFKVVNVPLPENDPDKSTTRYVSDGDLFGWLCVSIAFALLFVRELFRVHGSSHDSNFDTDLARDSH